MPALILLVVGELVLVATWFVHELGAAFPFVTEYAPPHYSASIIAGMAAMLGAYVLSRRLRGQALHVALASTVVALIAGVFAYALYHGGHAAPFVHDGFRGYLEPATAFHEQLALPFLATLGTIAGVFGFAAAERATG